MPYLYSKDTDGSHYYIYPETIVIAEVIGDYVYVFTTSCRKLPVKKSLKFVSNWLIEKGIAVAAIGRNKIVSSLFFEGITSEDKVIYKPAFINSIPEASRSLFENHSMQPESKIRMRRGSANYKKSEVEPESSSTIKTGDSTVSNETSGVNNEPSAIKKDVSTVKKKRNKREKRGLDPRK